MSKFQLMLTSLVAAVPGALLVYVLLMSLLFADGPPMLAYVAMGLTLIAASLICVIPPGVLVLGGKPKAATAAKGAAKAKAKAAPKPAQSSGEIELLDDEAALIDQSGDSIGLQEEEPEFELDDLDTEAGELAEETLDTEPVEEFEDFDLDEDEIDFDDEPPKKKKK